MLHHNSMVTPNFAVMAATVAISGAPAAVMAPSSANISWCAPEDWLYIYYPTRKHISAGLRAVVEASGLAYQFERLLPRSIKTAFQLTCNVTCARLCLSTLNIAYPFADSFPRTCPRAKGARELPLQSTKIFS